MSPARAKLTCPLCGSADRTAMFDKDGWPIVRCDECELVRVDRDLSSAELDEIYGEDYYAGDVFHDYLGERDVRVAAARANAARIARIEPRGRLLDVGCAAGFFLEGAAPYYDVTGVELSAFASDYARRELVHRVITGDLTSADLDGERFDVVTLWNTIEHVAEPAGVMAAAARVTRDGGLLVLSTGDVSGPLARRDLAGWNLMTPPQHLFFFSPATLERLLAGAGFELRRIVYDGAVAERGLAAGRRGRVVATVAGIGNVMTVYARRVECPRQGRQRRLAARYRPLRFV